MRPSLLRGVRHHLQIALKQSGADVLGAGRIRVVDAELDEQVVAGFHPVQHRLPVRGEGLRADHTFAVGHRVGDVRLVEPGLNASPPDRQVLHRGIAVEEGLKLTPPAARTARGAGLHRRFARQPDGDLTGGWRSTVGSSATGIGDGSAVDTGAAACARRSADPCAPPLPAPPAEPAEPPPSPAAVAEPPLPGPDTPPVCHPTRRPMPLRKKLYCRRSRPRLRCSKRRRRPRPSRRCRRIRRRSAGASPPHPPPKATPNSAVTITKRQVAFDSSAPATSCAGARAEGNLTAIAWVVVQPGRSRCQSFSISLPQSKNAPVA